MPATSSGEERTVVLAGNRSPTALVKNGDPCVERAFSTLYLEQNRISELKEDYRKKKRKNNRI